VARYNASQDEVRVRVSYQGNYDDAMAKLVSSLGTGEVPAVAFLGEGQAQRLIDSGAIAPVQDFIDREGHDLSDVDEQAIRCFTVQDKLWAMPFTTEVPLVYYNKIIFREAGLDPERPPQDLEELWQYSQKIRKRDASGQVLRSGIAMDIGTWMEGVLRLHGDPLVDKGNGREGRATKVLFDNDTGRWFFQWWHDMVDQGLAINVGRNPAYVEGFLAMAAGRAAMTFAWSGALRSVVDALEAGVEGAEGVEIGVGAFPGAPGSEGKTVLSCYGLWVIGRRPVEEQEAAWKFIKWLTEPEHQAEWFAGSGYLPVSRSSVELPAARDIVGRYPHFQVALDLYLEAPATGASLGALVGPNGEVREAIAQGVEQMLAGAKDPIQALEDAAARSDRAIEEYNERVGD